LSVSVDANEEFLQATIAAMELVYNIARRVVPRTEDAEDLVHETYLVAFKTWCTGESLFAITGGTGRYQGPALDDAAPGRAGRTSSRSSSG
jgi:hypothetical protein